MQVNTNIILLLLFLCGVWNPSFSQTASSEIKLQTALRLIGHQVLLASGDSSSLVKPIKKREETYIISFETPFRFLPDSLTQISERILSKVSLRASYTVEVENCSSGEIVYSFLINHEQGSMLPCLGRAHDKDCFNLRITPSPIEFELPALFSSTTLPTESTTQIEEPQWSKFSILLGGIIFFSLAFLNKYTAKKDNPTHLIPIGSILFDPIQMTLKREDQEIELTAKESELLQLLYTHLNTPLSRDQILREVWGDDGDYVGRTLDVFISKLRKKLMLEERVKIKNIRGVGYQLTLASSY